MASGGLREHWLTERVAAPCAAVYADAGWLVLWCAEAMRAMPIQSFCEGRAMPRLSQEHLQLLVSSEHQGLVLQVAASR